MTQRRLQLLLAVSYGAIGLAVYAPVLGAFFLADDFAYLDTIRTTGSPSVMFSALAGRYFRPIAMFVYYANYQISGLSPWSYHVSMLLVHLANTWLVFLLGRQLAPGRTPLLAALAGLLFLVFGGHAEAISWISGMADPLVTLFVLCGLFCFLRALDSPTPMVWTVGVWFAFLGALFSKESSAIFPGLVVLALFAHAKGLDRNRVKRAIITLAAIAVMAIAYIALRRYVLGFSFLTLEGLGTSASLLLSARQFFMRSFLPQGALTLWLWSHHADLLGWLVVGVGCVWGLLRTEYRALTFLALCLFLALAPVLPLSIAMATTDSERLIYLPSAFACLLVVWTLDALLRRPALVALVTAVFCTWHVVELRRHNHLWKAAGLMTQEMTESFGRTVREQWRPGEPIFLLGLPDNLRSKFLWRRGFHEGLRVTSPDLAPAIAGVHVVSIVNLDALDARIQGLQLEPRTFELRLTKGTLADGPATSGHYAAREVTPTRFVVDFAAFTGEGLVIYFTPSLTAVAGRLAKPTVPFGFIDLPAGAITCNGTDSPLLGWALDYEGIARVTVAIEHSEGNGPPITIGEAERQRRPDVTKAFPGFPDSNNAGWAFATPCTSARAKGLHGSTQIVVIAENVRGGRTRLGTRGLALSK